jgi:polar amino acid transport system substrate-binding protein
VAVQDQLPPLAWREGNGQRQGLEIELARALATQMLGDPNAIEWVPVRNRDRIAAVTQNEVDLAIAQLGITADRLRSVSFSTPYYLDGTAIVVPAGATPQTATDLTDETIAVLKGSSAVPTLNAALPNLTLVGVDSYQEGVAALQKGQVEGLAADASVLVGWIGDRSDYRLLKPLLSGVGLAIAMPKGNQYAELRRRVHQQMQTWADSEWLEQRAAAWGLP